MNETRLSGREYQMGVGEGGRLARPGRQTDRQGDTSKETLYIVQNTPIPIYK